MRKIDERSRHSDREGSKSLAHPHLHINRHLTILLFVCLDLSTEVLGNEGYRPLSFRFKPIKTKVYAHRHRVIITNVRSYEFCRDTTHQITC